MCQASWSCAGWWGPVSAWTKVGRPEGISQCLRSAAACSGVMSKAKRQEAGRTQTLPGSQAGIWGQAGPAVCGGPRSSSGNEEKLRSSWNYLKVRNHEEVGELMTH